MPTYEVTHPDGRKLEIDGERPPTESELNDIFAKVGGNASSPSVPPKKEGIDWGGMARSFLAGVGGGMVDIATGIRQKAAEFGEGAGMVETSTVQGINRELKDIREARKSLEEGNTSAKIGGFVGETAPFVTMPGGVSGGFLKRAATSALAGGTMGALRGTTEGESQAQNTAFGALGGAGGSILLSGGGKLINAGLNKMGNKSAEAIINAGKEKGIDVSLGEALQSPNLQRAETWLERLPGWFGLSKYRKDVLQQTNDAIKDYAKQYIANENNPTGVGNRAFVNGLYEDMKAMVGDVKELPFYASETASKAKDLLKRYPDLFKKFQDTTREDLLKKVSGETTYQPGSRSLELIERAKNQNKSIDAEMKAIAGMAARSPEEINPFDKLSYIINQQGTAKAGITPDITKGIPVPANQVTFDDMWSLRNGLGDMIGAAKKQLQRGEIDKTVISQLNQLYSAVNNDIDKWASSVGRPELRKAINAANDGYKNYVVKYNIIQDAIDKSKTMIGGEEIISPKKFSTALTKESIKNERLTRMGVKGIFDRTEINEMAGMSSILDIVKRAGQYAENPPTGDRWGFPALVLATAHWGNLQAASTELGVASVAKFLTTTTAGKRLALSASKIEPDSPAMAELVNQIYNQIPKLTSQASQGVAQ